MRSQLRPGEGRVVVRGVDGAGAIGRRRSGRQPPALRRRRVRRRAPHRLRGVLPPGEQLLDRGRRHALRQERRRYFGFIIRFK